MNSHLLFALNTTLPMFFLMMLGYHLKHKGKISDSFLKDANKLVFRVALPVQLFNSMSTCNIRANFDGRYILFCAIFTLISIIVLWVSARIFLKDKTLVGEFVQASYRSSAAILGAAYIELIYGHATAAGLMIIGAVPIYNIFAVTILMLESPARTDQMDYKNTIKTTIINIAKNPIIIGIFLGSIWDLSGLSMPDVFASTLSYVAKLTTPLALICIGGGLNLQLRGSNLRTALSATFVKLMLLPMLGMPMAILMGFREEKLLSVLIMLGSITTPTAYIMAKETGHEGSLTAAICALTTLICSFTLTFWLFVIKSMGYI